MLLASGKNLSSWGKAVFKSIREAIAGFAEKKRCCMKHMKDVLPRAKRKKVIGKRNPIGPATVCEDRTAVLLRGCSVRGLLGN